MGVFLFILCVVAKRRCHLQRVRPPPPVPATRLSHGRLRGHCGGRAAVVGDLQGTPLSIPPPVRLLSRCNVAGFFPFSPARYGNFNRGTGTRWYRRCFCTAIQAAVASILARCAAAHMSPLILHCWVNTVYVDSYFCSSEAIFRVACMAEDHIVPQCCPSPSLHLYISATLLTSNAAVFINTHST